MRICIRHLGPLSGLQLALSFIALGCRVSIFGKTMHAQSPLETDQQALHPRQENQGQQKGQRNPDQRVDPRVGCVCLFDEQNAGNDDMADHEYGEVRRRVVSAMMVQCFTAMIAMIYNLEIGAEETTLAAGRALETGSTKHCAEHGWPRLGSGLRAGCLTGCDVDGHNMYWPLQMESRQGGQWPRMCKI